MTGVGATSGGNPRDAGLRISSEPDATFDVLKVLGDGNNEYNMVVTGFRDYQPVAILLRDDAGVIRGGIWGWVWAQWLYVANLSSRSACAVEGWGARATGGCRGRGPPRGSQERVPGDLQLPGATVLRGAGVRGHR